MSKWLDYFDISDAVAKGTNRVGHIKGLPAFLLGALLLFINYQLWPYIYMLDLQPTQDFGTNVATRMNVGMDPVTFGTALLSGMLLPTLIEMAAPIFSQAGIVVASWLWWATVAFDAWTDNPAVVRILDTHRATFDGLGWIGGWVTYQIVRVVMLIGASMILEFYFAVTSVVAFVLLWQARPARKPKSPLEAKVIEMKAKPVTRIRR